jgi:D-3-phosphoglycerate dehydrogenase
MNITVLDDYQDTVRTLPAFRKVAGHTVTIWNDHTTDIDVLVERLKDTEALALIRERTPIRAPLLDRLDQLRIISQVSVYPHIDVEACTRRGIILSSDPMPGRPSFATTELAWGLILCAMRRIPQGSPRSKLESGKPDPSDSACTGRRWASMAMARPAELWPDTARRSACG